jgi:hypothetical protein
MEETTTKRDASKPAIWGIGVGSNNLWADAANGALENWMQRSADMMKVTADAAQDSMAFSQEQLQAAMELWKELAACRSPEAFFDCQRKFAEKIAAHYLAELGKLSSRITKLMTVASPLCNVKSANR